MHLCALERARERQANDTLSSLRWRSVVSPQQRWKKQTFRTRNETFSIPIFFRERLSSTSPFAPPFFPHLPASPPRFRAQELHSQQQRRRPERQPSDSRQGLLGLDGFRPPQRGGVRVFFVTPPHARKTGKIKTTKTKTRKLATHHLTT